MNTFVPDPDNLTENTPLEYRQLLLLSQVLSVQSFGKLRMSFWGFERFGQVENRLLTFRHLSSKYVVLNKSLQYFYHLLRLRFRTTHRVNQRQKRDWMKKMMYVHLSLLFLIPSCSLQCGIRYNSELNYYYYWIWTHMLYTVEGELHQCFLEG